MSRFRKGDRVIHRKGGYYLIEEVPENCRIEATNEPAYAYRAADNTLWIRCQKEMEDGRFERDWGQP